MKQNRRRKEIPGEERWIKIKGRFGLTKEQWLALLERQEGRCAICGGTDPRQGNLVKFFHTDHTEEHGHVEVRGLLCGPCNQGLGYFDHDSNRLRAAAGYLVSWREAQGG